MQKCQSSAGSEGGRIYIGISDDLTVFGCKGTFSDWEESLFNRTKGIIKPKPDISYHTFKIDKTKYTKYKNELIIRIDIQKSKEPIHYKDGIPVIRDGTESRKAEPEEVKYKFYQFIKQNGVNSLENSEETNKEKLKLKIFEYLVNIKIVTNQRNLMWKSVNEQISIQNQILQQIRDYLDESIYDIEATLGSDSRFCKFCRELSEKIYEIQNDPSQDMISGKSREEWLNELDKICEEYFQLFIDELEIDCLDVSKKLSKSINETQLWINGTEKNQLQPFQKESFNYAIKFLSLYWYAKVSNCFDDSIQQILIQTGNLLEQLSWDNLTLGSTPINIVEKIKDNLKLLSGALQG